MAERMTTQELAAWLGVSDRTVKTWRAEGMPYLPRGGNAAHLHDPDAVTAWLRETERAGWIPAEEGA